MKHARKLALGLVALTIAALLAWAYRPQAIQVSVARVSRGPLQVVIVEDGRTRVRERYVITPPVSGYMARLALHEGDAVQAGQALFALEPLPVTALDARARAEAEARVARADAALRAAEADAGVAATGAAFAIREQARLRPLFDTGQVSKAQYDRAASEADRADAALASARAAIEVARYEKRTAATVLRYLTGERATSGRIQVAAPVGGVVLEVLREDEGVVAAGQPVLSIGEPGSLEIVTDVLSGDAVRIRPGMAVRIERWGGDGALEARVRTVSPTAFTKISALGVEEQRVRVVSDLVSPPELWRRLGDAYRVETHFIAWEAADVLRVPHSSLIRAGQQWSVFTVRDGVLRQRAVEVGHRGLLHAEIAAGLEPGESVVTYPDDQLAEGARAVIRETEP